MLNSSGPLRSLDSTPSRRDGPAVLFAVFQTGNRANGGVESITQVVERLRHSRPVVLTQSETPVCDRWRAAGAEVHIRALAPARSVASRARALADYNTFTSRLLRSTGANVLHANDIGPIWSCAFGARAVGVPIVFNIRDANEMGSAYVRAKWRTAFFLSQRQIVLSQEMRDHYTRSLGVSGAGTEVIYSVVDPDRFFPPSPAERAQLRDQFGMSDSAFVISYVAVFSKKKAQLDWIEGTLPRLRDQIPALSVHFVGDFDPDANPYARVCAAAVDRLGLGGVVRFEGYRDDVPAWYRASDVVALASRKEGLARAMIEALACGTPVVSFAVSSAREILEAHRCGAVVETGDYAGFATALADLEAAPEKQVLFGERGAALAKRLFAPGPVVDAYEDVYADVDGSKGTATWPPKVP